MEGPLLLDLFPLVGYVVAAGMVYALWGISRGLGGFLGSVLRWTSPISFLLETPVNAGFKWLDTELGAVANKLDKQIAISFHRVAGVIVNTAELFIGISALLLLLAWRYSGLKMAITAVEHLTRSQSHAVTATKVAVDHLGRTRKVNEANAAAAGAAAAAAATSTLVRFVGHAGTTAAAGTHTGARPVAADIPFDLAGLRDRTKAIEEGLSDVYDQIKAHGVSIAKAGSIAAVAAAILKMGLGWTRCNNVGKVGKALCGAPLHRIEELLALATDFFIIADICQVIGLLERAVAPVLDALSPLIAHAGAALCHGEHKPPDGLNVPELYLPPVLSALPA